MVEITERPNESGFRQRRYAGEIRRARANRETVRIKATIQTHALEFGVRPVQACTSTVLLRGSVVWMAAAGGGQLSGSVQEKRVPWRRVRTGRRWSGRTGLIRLGAALLEGLMERGG